MQIMSEAANELSGKTIEIIFNFYHSSRMGISGTNVLYFPSCSDKWQKNGDQQTLVTDVLGYSSIVNAWNLSISSLRQHNCSSHISSSFYIIISQQVV
jgi:hypothetical protein